LRLPLFAILAAVLSNTSFALCEKSEEKHITVIKRKISLFILCLFLSVIRAF
jgi:hypothetical protein